MAYATRCSSNTRNGLRTLSLLQRYTQRVAYAARGLFRQPHKRGPWVERARGATERVLAQELLCKSKFGFYNTRSSQTVVRVPGRALKNFLKKLQPGLANLPASAAGSQVNVPTDAPSSRAELFSTESLVRATDQQSELITRPSADGTASKEVSAAAAVAHVPLHGGTQTAQQQDLCHRLDWGLAHIWSTAPYSTTKRRPTRCSIRRTFRCSIDFF